MSGKTPIVALTGDAVSAQRALAAATEALEAGGVILVPTDTVYGLACLPSRPEAVRRVYAMKDRPHDVRLPIIVADAAHAEAALPLRWTPAARALADAFWPGALTIVFGIEPSPLHWLAGREEAGLRAPAHPLVADLARSVGPFLMTSANRHGGPTSPTVAQILADLVSPPALTIDSGQLEVVSSTLVNTNLPEPAIEREGAIAAQRIAEVLSRAV
jgi:L-threonylcarbamoyladenylate synthase